MSKEFEGTPNPLNPNLRLSTLNSEPTINPEPTTNLKPLDANSSELVAPNNSGRSVDGMINPQPVQEIVEKTDVVIEETAPIDPMARPMEKAPEPTNKPKKKKTGLVVGILICLLVTVGCGVAAMLLTLNAQNADRVLAAMNKLMGGEVPKLIAIEGDINLTSTDDTLPYSSLAIKFNAGINGKTNENFANATVAAILPNKTKSSFDASEIKTSGGDLYLKLSGIVDALDGLGSSVVDNVECTNKEDEECLEQTALVNLDFSNVFEIIDDEWIRIPSSEFSNLTDVVPVDKTVPCLIDVAGNLSKYNNNFAEIYNNNPFIIYSTENLTVSQKKDPLYRIGFDDEKLAGFINSMNNFDFLNEMLACTDNLAMNQEVTANDLSRITTILPEMYVEIDENNDFTRVYFDFSDIEEDTNSTITADLSLFYPTSIMVQDPENYIDIDEALSEILKTLYGEDVYGFTIE